MVLLLGAMGKEIMNAAPLEPVPPFFQNDLPVAEFFCGEWHAVAVIIDLIEIFVDVA